MFARIEGHLRCFSGAAIIGALVLLSCEIRSPLARAAHDVDALYGSGPPFPFRWEGASLRGARAGLPDRTAVIVSVLRLGERMGDDAEWMRIRARLALVENDPGTAIALYTRARLVSHKTSGIAAELAAAYALRASADQRDVDYRAALEFAAQALAEQPGSAAARYNFALVAEQIPLPRLALAQWREVVARETDAAWREEARRHERKLTLWLEQRNRAIEQLRSPQPVDARLLAAPGALEIRQDSALKLWIVSRNPPWPEMRELAKAFAEHQDRWWTDFTRAPGGADALGLLSRTLQANARGDHALAESTGAQAEAAFAHIGNSAGRLWARRERILASHRGDNLQACGKLIRDFREEAERRSYVWLAAEASLDEITCKTENLRGSTLEQRAAAYRRIAATALEGATLRALAFLAEPWVAADSPLRMWSIAREGLRRFSAGAIPGYRAYHFTWNLADSAAELGDLQASRMLLREAVLELEDDENPGVRATALSDLAAAEARVGARGPSLEHLETAARLLDRAGDAAAEKYRRETTIERAFGEMLAYHPRDAIYRLDQLEASIPPGANEMDRADFLNAYGLVLLNAGRFREAEGRFRQLLAVNARVLGSNDPIERQSLSRRFESASRGLVEVLVRAGHPGEALRVWTAFQNGRSPEQHIAISTLPGDARLSYAFLPGGVSAWLSIGGVVEQRWIAEQDVNDAALRLAGLAADPNAPVAAIRDAGIRAGRLLLGPFEQRLSSLSGTLAISADRLLYTVPWPAVRTEKGDALIERYPIVQTMGAIPARNSAATRIAATTRAAIFAAPIQPAIPGLPPLRDALEEGRRVARRFVAAALVSGEDATAARLLREAQAAQILHFAGHGISNGGFGALVVAGSRAYVVAADIAALNLSHLQLVVLASCSSGVGAESRAVSSDLLVRAFLASGARHVVAASWPVESLAAAGLSDRFYGALLRGEAPARALQRAILDVAADPLGGHPSVWAAFQMYGTP